MAIPRIFGCNTSGPNNIWNPDTVLVRNTNWYAGMQRFGNVVGRATNSTCLYPCSGPMATWPSNLFRLISGITQVCGTNFVPVLKMKMVSAGVAPENYAWTDPKAYQDVKNGVWDKMIVSCVQSLAFSGLPYAILCLSYDHNVTRDSASMGNDTVTQTAWQAAFGHFASVVAAQAVASGIRIDIALCPSTAYACPNVTALIPDMTNVDILALDVSNAFYGPGDYTQPGTRINFWNTGFGGYGLFQHAALAQTLGLPVMFPEVRSGQSAGPSIKSVANDPVFFMWLAGAVTTIRSQSTPFLGMNILDRGPYAVSTGAQPVCLAQITSNLATFVGDQIS